MASAPRNVTCCPSRIVVKLAFRMALKAKRPRAPKAVTTRRFRSSSLMVAVAWAKSFMMSTIERICPVCSSKTFTPALVIAC